MTPRGPAHPLPLAAALVLALNDHVWKPAGWPTPAMAGKLSDVAGLFVFPIVLAAIVRALGGGWRPGAAAVATAAAFTAVKLSPAVNAAVEAAWGANALDAWDLVALPAAGAAWWWMRQPALPGARARALRGGALVAVTLACAATPAPRYARNYPRWVVKRGQDARAGCVIASAYPVKSGKTGLGLTVRLRGATAAGCSARVAAARLVLTDGTESVARLARAPARALDACADENVYLPFLFDSERAWNDGVRNATVTIELEAGGARHTWTLDVAHELDGYYRERHEPPAPEPEPDCRADAPLERAQ
ncbi:MAG TPA: hypothetical protein VMZ28_02200 [Kofleriaceae bacterium]|nr:hypothetical protein [Kofleriaceae bacterium]